MQNNDAFLVLKLLFLVFLGALTFPIWIWLVPWALIEWERENKEKGELAHKTEDKVLTLKKVQGTSTI